MFFLFTVSSLRFHIEPEEGSLAGGTWITVLFDGRFGSYQMQVSYLLRILNNVSLLPWLRTGIKEGLKGVGPTD